MGIRSGDKGGGVSAGGPMAELSLPRFAILTAVLPAPPLPLDKAIRTDALFDGQHILPRDCASICPERFIVFSALCFCFSCCLLLL